ncbi:hypothetical protein [Flavobacterium sp. CS20]|uniref:hypothetical protein n=1 Tax=Flavobacterium sp. CS20 TaxID=2775246 RepID=UPI001B3A0EB2|nr:hypothetical protein [Flavobacterium sp. CS20]QTY28079.1 hypothetical protein IGB25_06215 [Flavobacterium sp. CS20]
MKIKKTILFLFSLLLCLSSCKDETKQEHKDSNQSHQVELPKQTANNQKKETLTKEQAGNFFPKQIGDYKLINIEDNLLKTNGIAFGMYIKGNDYDHSLTYTLEDGNRKGSAILKNFEDAYKTTAKGPEGTEIFRKERNGYKTIAFLQHNINRYSISFIYNQRFRLSLDGVEKPDVLWTYFKKEDLQKLNTY